MADLSGVKFDVKKAKTNMRRAELKLKQISTTSDVENYSKSVADLMARGRRQREAPATERGTGGGSPRSPIPIINIPMLAQGPISEFPNVLYSIQGRPIIETWLQEMIPQTTGPDETYYMINPVDDVLEKLEKIDVYVGKNLEFSFPSSPEIFLTQSCSPAVLEFFRYVVGLMEQFYQKTDNTNKTLRNRHIQLVVKAFRLCVPEGGTTSRQHDVVGSPKDAILINSYYIVSLKGEAPQLSFENIAEEKPEIKRPLTQDTLTLWRNDIHAHMVEGKTGPSKALVLSISLVDPANEDVFTD